ncbi:MAG: DUF2845 domain-containing protein [Steroidobacteraceae bacterium]
MRAMLLFALAAVAAPAGADSFRCGVRLVTDGTTMAEVRSLCGEPVSVIRREVWRRPAMWIKGRRYFLSDSEVAVPVEYWTYNFGPHRLMRRVRFEDGVVTDIETLEHGYNEPDPAP